MTKHAVNAFLATSVVFINEIAAACEATGADAKEVERGLKSESRRAGAYLGPGGLRGRDARARRGILLGIGARGLPTPLFAGVAEQRRPPRWARRRLAPCSGTCVAGRSPSSASPTRRTPTRCGGPSRSRSATGWLARARSCAHDLAITQTRPSSCAPDAHDEPRRGDPRRRGDRRRDEWPAFASSRASARRRGGGAPARARRQSISGGQPRRRRARPLRRGRRARRRERARMKLQGRKILIRARARASASPSPNAASPRGPTSPSRALARLDRVGRRVAREGGERPASPRRRRRLEREAGRALV
jgi:hypothetical protein